MIYLIIETILLIGAIMMIILLSILLGIAERRINRAVNRIESFYGLGFRGGKTIISEMLDDLLKILGGKK